MEAFERVNGHKEVIEYFGRWPSFHDAEIKALLLDHTGSSRLTMYTWNTHSDVDERGYFRQTQHALVHFEMDDVRRVDLEAFNTGSIIFGLELAYAEDEFRIELDPCVGLSGTITCQSLRLSFEPYSQQR